MMNIRGIFAAAAVAVLGAAACTDATPGAPHTPPPPPPVGRGMVVGTVVGDKVTFEPITISPSYSGGVSPASYGNQGITVQLYGTVVSTVIVPNVSITWGIKIGFRNLEAYPIGSNSGATSPLDTAGIFLFFPSGDPVITSPASCPGCTLTITNTMGTQNFTNPGQKYFWYHNRLQAMQLTPGSDTSYGDLVHPTPVWQFQSNSDQVTGFRFTVMVNADWPPPYETTWSTTWIAATDSLPDDNGEPDWQEYAAVGDPGLGTDVIQGAVMRLTAPDGNSSIYMARHDSIGDGPLRIDAVVRDSAAMSEFQAVIGYAEPMGAPETMGFIGIAGSAVRFVRFNEGTGTWTNLNDTNTPTDRYNCTSGPCSNTYTTSHLYSLRKFGEDSVVVCIDGARRLWARYSSMQLTTTSFSKASVVFGTRSSNSTDKTSYWTSVIYWIGAGTPGTTGSVQGDACSS